MKLKHRGNGELLHLFKCSKMRYLQVILFSIVWACGSPEVRKDNAAPTFKSFEISYTNGWAERFSFRADSNKIYFTAMRPDTLQYGILPDSIFNLLKTCYAKLKTDSTIKSTTSTCVDCPIVAIKVEYANGVIRLNETGQINEILERLIVSIQTFINKGKHLQVRSTLILETDSTIYPPPVPPPPILEQKRFRTPRKD